MRVPLTARRENQSILKEINPEYSLEELMTSLVAQIVKNPPAIQETWLRSLGWEDPLEKENVIHSSILTWRISMDSPWDHKVLDRMKQLSLHCKNTLMWEFINKEKQ